MASGENPFRILRLFDSFEGLPEITSPVDQGAPHVISGACAKGGCKVLAAPELRERIGKILPPHRFELYEGWFADTVKFLPARDPVRADPFRRRPVSVHNRCARSVVRQRNDLDRRHPLFRRLEYEPRDSDHRRTPSLEGIGRKAWHRCQQQQRRRLLSRRHAVYHPFLSRRSSGSRVTDAPPPVLIAKQLRRPRARIE
jgi:hypothetical protein